MSLPEIDPVFGQTPEIGHEIYVDFGDSFYARPEMRAEVEDISDDGIKLDGEWFLWEELVHIEVVG